MKTDIEIASETKVQPIKEIVNKIGLSESVVEYYGTNKAKLDYKKINSRDTQENLILVTSISPTSAGEGKTTTTIGLADGLNALNKKVIAALREPSLGPVFGLKGGATGGGYSQVVPMDDINLHFTGDMHAITTANNLICAMVDNHIHQGNELEINPDKIVFKRALDINDRSLREITIGQGSNANGTERKDGFKITVASEVMAVLCLVNNVEEFKEKIGEIIIGYSFCDKPIFVKDLKITGAIAIIMKDAIKPNLVQTLEGTPVLIHGGPFANIAHGCNSLIATKLSLRLADYVVTEAGFGADLGSEKFIDIKTRIGELNPTAIVLVATIRALKLHGGASNKMLNEEDLDSLKKGINNLKRHFSIISSYGLNHIITINKFSTDTENEINLLMTLCQQFGVNVIINNSFEEGSKGSVELAKEVVKLCENKNENDLKYVYELEDDFEVKLNKVIKNIYGGNGFELAENAKKQLKELTLNGYHKLPICVAKTPNSFSDDPKLIGAPTNFKIYIKELQICAGAGFIVVITGNIMTMPGLGKKPAALMMEIDSDNNITGLS